MDFKFWLRGWRFLAPTSQTKRPRRAGQKTLPYAKLRLEELENRIAPAAVSWTGNAGTLNWGDANNWSNTAVPTSADDVTINKAGVGTINIGSGTYAVDSLNDTTAVLSIASGGSLSLAAVAMTSTFGENVTVAQGATLTVGAGASVLLGSNVTLTDNGTVSFGGNQVTFGVTPISYNSSTTEQIAVGGGGVLNASGTTFSLPSVTTYYNSVDSGSINVAVNGQLTPTGSAFDVPVFLPAAAVAGLGSNNLRYADIDILGGTLASGSVALNVICTNTTNLRYVFSASLTVAQGATLTVAAGLPVLIQSNVTLTDNGTVSFGAGDTVTFGVTPTSSNSSTTEQLAVGGGGLLNASGTTFSLPSVTTYSNSVDAGSINVAVNGQLTPTGSAFDVPVYLPAAAVAGLGSNNLRYGDIDILGDILGGTLASGSVALNVICTNTTNLRYVFSASLTVAQGATLTVAPGLPVLIQSNVTLTDNGTVSFGTGDTVTFGVTPTSSNSSTTEQLAVGGGGLLNASGTTFSLPSVTTYSNSVDAGSINVAVNGQLTPTSSAFDVPVYLPAAAVAGLGSNNLRYADIDILGGTLASGSVALNVICTNTTNLRYVFSAPLTVSQGATLTVAAGLPVLLQSNVTLTDNGTVSFGAGDTVTFGVTPTSSNSSTTEQIAVGGGGLLNASGTTFSLPSVTTYSNSVDAGSINVAVNGQLTPSGSAFDVPVYLPAAAVAGLGSNNLRYADIDILGGTLASGSVALNVICTNTTNLRYVFSGSLTVAQGATLTVAPSLPVLLGSNVTLTDNGTLNFGAGDTVTFGVTPTSSNSSTTEQIAVGGGGLLSASGTTFSLPSVTSYSNSVDSGSINVAVNGQLTPTGSAFDVPVYLPAAAVAGLGSNNLRYGDIDILGGTLTSGSVALNVICTNTTNLRYVFSAPLTVSQGATLTVAAGLPVLLQSNVTLTDNGTVSFGAGDTVTFGVTPTSSNSSTTEQIAVGGGGLLSASGTTFTLPSVTTYSNSVDAGSINVAVNGQLTPTGSAFDVPVYLPAAAVAGLGSNNLRYADIDILGGTLASGSVALNVICTNTTNLRYVFSAPLTVAQGATLTVAPGLPVLIGSNVTLTDNGTMSFGSLDQVTFGVTPTSSNSSTMEQIVVGGGVLSASGATFTLPSVTTYSNSVDTGLISVNSGGQLIASNSTFALSSLSLNNNSTDTLSMDVISCQLAINSGASFTINQNDLSNVPGSNQGIIASGNGNTSINLTNNYWGTTVAAQIAAKITDQNNPSSNPALPTVLYQPYLTLEPVQTTAAAASTIISTAAQNITLSATVTSPSGLVSQGTETFTVLSGATVIGSPVTVSVSSGAASASYTLPAGTAAATYTIQAVYNGTSYYSSSTDTSHSLTVSRVVPYSAMVAVTGAPDPVLFGQSATLTATVSPAVGPGAGFAVPTASSDPYYITTGPDGNLWFTEASGNKIGRITPSGTFTEFAVPTANSNPLGITAGPDGNVWFTEYAANKIGRITPSGTITEFTVPTANSLPDVITAGPDGNLWFTEGAGNKIGRITPSGTITEFTVPTASSNPLGITAGPDGNLWFTETNSNKIGRITPSGTFTEFAVPTASSALFLITTGPDGNLWFTEYSGDNIGRITPSGTVTEFAVPTASSQPFGITAAPDGNLWFTEAAGDKIGRITPSGTVTEFAVPTASSRPVSITTGPDGNLWFTESAGNNIGQINPGAPSGTVQFVIDGTNFGNPVSLSGGGASVSDAAMSVGLHTVTASYSGDSNFSASIGSLSGGERVTQGTPLPAGTYGGTLTSNTELYATTGTYVLNNLTIPHGVTLTLDPGVSVQIGAGQTLTDNGTLSFGSGDTVTFGVGGNSVTEQIVVGSGGVLNAVGTTFTASTYYNTSVIEAKPGSSFTANSCTFSINYLSLDPGYAANVGDLVGNTFSTSVYLPAADVQFLSGTTTNNLFSGSTAAIDIWANTISSGTLTLNAIGSTASYVFPAIFPASATQSGGAFTIANGATLTVAPNVRVLIQAGGTLTDNGTLSFGTGDTVTFGVGGNSVTEQIVVGSGGVLNAVGTTFTASTYYNTSVIEAKPGSSFTANSCTFSINYLSLDPGYAANVGDLVGNTFSTSVYLPAADVQFLSGTTTNNLFSGSTAAIDIWANTISSGTLTLNAIGSTASYVFPAIFPASATQSGGAFTIANGATLTVAPNVRVLIQAGGTLTDNGTLSFGTGDTVTFGVGGNSVTEQIVVGSGGVLNAVGTTFTASTYYNTSVIEAKPGSSFTANSCTFSINYLSLDPGYAANVGDLVGNTFSTSVYLPAADVQFLSGTTTNNLFSGSTAAIDIWANTISSGTLTLNAIGSTASYVFPAIFPASATQSGGAFTIANGATLTVAPNVRVLIQAGGTLTDNGTLSFGSGDTVTFGVSGDSATEQIVVGSGGVLNAAGTTFTAPTYYNTGLIDATGGGGLTASTTSFALTQISLSNGSYDTLGADIISCQLAINSGATISITGNDFSSASATVVASGVSTATINLDNNYWGTTNTSQIAAKITDHVTNSNLPTVSYNPFLSASPSAISGVVFNDLNSNGIQDSGEPGLGGVVVYIDSNNTGVFAAGDPSTVTNAAGQYTFNGLTPGTYIVREVVPTGAVETDPSPAAVATTVYFDGAGAEAGVTGAGTTSFSYQGASFSGGVVFSPGQSALLASGTQAYNASSGTAEVDFSHPISSVSFFYVHNSSFAAGTATAYGADGTLLGTVGSNLATTNNDPANYVTLGGFAEPIARITFSGGVVDNFTFTTAANDQAYYVHLLAGQSTGGINFGTPGTVETAANASATFSTAAQNVTFNAVVTSPYGVVNAGSVTFTVLYNDSPVGTAVTSSTVVAGAASAVYSLPAGAPVGVYTIQAAYNGTANFQSTSDSTHFLTVSAATTTMAAASAVATFNGLSSQTVALSATVTSAAGTVNEGTETFTILSGGTVIGNPVVVNVGAGVASTSYTLPAGAPGGSYTIQAVYNDTGNYVGSTDTSHSLTVNAAADSTAASTVTAVYSAASQSVALSAAITSSAGAVNQGTETFTILSGTNVVGNPVTVNVSNGAASATYPLPAGATPTTYTIQAVYNGTSSFGTSTDTTHALTVTSAPAATVSVSLDSHTDSGAPNYPAYTNYATPSFDVQVNQAGTITVDFDGNAAHDQTQTVSAAGTYQFTAPSLANGSYTTTATFNAGLSGTPQNSTNYTIDTVPPQVAAMTPSGPVNTTVSQVSITFSEPVALQTFTPSAITLTGPAGAISVQQPQLVSGNTYSIGFATQTVQGPYSLTIAASVTDFASNALSQAYNNSFTIALPALAVTSSSAPSSAAEGASIPVSWQVANVSPTNPTGATWTDAVYVSSKSVLDSTAVQLTSVAGPTSPLAPNSSYSRNANVTLPGNLAAGNYYILFVADDNGGQLQSSTANNVVAQPIVLSAPDLQVTGVSGPATGFTGQTVTVSWTDVNTGMGTATGPWVDNVYTATSANGSNPTLIGSFTFTGSLAAGASTPLTQQVVLPQTAGTQWFMVTTNATQTVLEANTANDTSVAAASTSITAVPLPDLVVTSITPPANGVFSGNSVPVSFVVKNQGQAATSASTWQDWVILSQNPNLTQTYQGQLNATGPGGDQTLNAQPVVLGFSNPSYLGVGQSYQQNVSVPLPINAQGVWYVYVVPDGTGAQHPFAMPEASRTDKLTISAAFSVTLSPTPDLAVSGVQAPAQDFSGQPMKVSWTVSNIGLGPTVASAWTDAVYMSPTATLGSTATLLATFPHQGGLTAGAGYTSKQTVTLPVGVSGSFYFIVKTDLNGQVFENGATANNVAPTPTAETVNFTPPPDLTVSSITTPATALAGHGLTFSYTVTNHGAGATPNYTWNDALYLSPTATYQSGTAISLGQQNHQGSLAPAASYTNTVTVTLPNGLLGSYYIVVDTDSGSAVFELNKTNNLSVSTSAITVSAAPADLVVASASAPAAALPGSAILVNWTVANQSTGDTAVSAWQDSVYIDTGAMLSSHAVLLGTFEHYGLVTGGGSYSQSQLLTLPIGLQAGNYNLFVVANSAGDVYESNTSNNTSAPLPISLSQHLASGSGGVVVGQAQVSDLQLTSVTGSTTGATGGNVTVNWTVKNIGAGATDANSWDDDVWVSTNPTLGSGGTDVYLGTVQHNNPLASGASYSTAGTFAMPSTMTAGSYYFIVAVDRPVAPPGAYEGVDLDYETNYTNNELAASSTTAVTAGSTPNLTVSGVTAPVTATAGQQLALSWTVTNNGAATGTVPITDSVYLSYDKVLDSTDRYLGSVKYQGGLGAGASYTQNASIALPAGLTGTFYVFVVTNSDMSIFEQNSSNNSAYDSQTVQIQLAPAADLAAGTVTTPANAVAGQNVTITYQVTNSGGQAANGSWSDALYLSPTQTWSVSDPLLGIVSQTQNLAPGGSYTGTLTAPVPGVAPGSYYVILRTNILDNLAEQTLGNNLSVSLTQTAIDAPALTLGQPTNGTLNQGQSVYYKAVVSAGQTLQVDLTGNGAGVYNELYVSFGTMPTRSTYDYRYSQPFAANQQITIPTTQAGAYYILAYGNTVPSPPESYSITAAVIPFSIQSVTPGQAGAGPVTLQISGAQFAFSTSFQLRNAMGTIFHATRTLLQDSSTAFATFNLTGLPLGSYDVWAVQSNGTSTKLSAGLNVVAAAPNSVQVALIVPNAVLVGRPGTVTVTYSNPGNTDLPAPLILLNGDNALFQVPGQSGYTSSSLQLLGLNPDGPFGTLPPGFKGSITVPFAPVTAGAGLLSTFTLQTLDNPSEPFDWNAFAANDVPLDTSPQQWSAMVSQAAPLMGNTWGAVVSFLDNDSVQLVKNAGVQTDPNALNSLYNFDGLLQYVVGVYGTTNPVAATPSFPVVATDGEVTVYNANVNGAGNAAPLNSSYPTFVIIPGFGGYQADYGSLAAAIAADTAKFPNGQVNVLVATWQGATDGPTIAGVNVPWVAALHVDTDGGELGDILTSLEQQGGISLTATTIVSEGLGNDVGNEAAKIAGGLGNAIALNPASALSGYLPSSLTTYFQQSIAYETSSFLDTQLSLAASNQTLDTGDDNNPILQHTSGVPWLAGQILAGNDSLLNPGNTTGSNALPAENDPAPLSSVTGLVVSSATVEQIISHDPNSIIGPKGAGTGAMVPLDQPLPYTIDFSNTSEGPVQEMSISEQIDTPDLDEGTFDLTSFGFNGTTYSIPADAGGSYQTTIDLTQELGYEVEFTANIDETTGLATWTFETIDPSTGQLPLAATVGFLSEEPLSTTTTTTTFGGGNEVGQGFVSYTIMPTSTDATGTTITAQAAVAFDTQSPLDTNEVSNTVDTGAGLTSSVAALPAFENSTTFPVSWSGSDSSNGSGLDNYTIYVSDNGGPYTAWLQNTTLTSAPFAGQDGHTYSFYSVAADNAGNMQATPTTAQAATEVDATPPTTTAFSLPAPGASYNASHWTGTISGSASDSVSGVQQEQVSILDATTNMYWNGMAFSSSTEDFFTATLTNPGANLTSWSLSFPSSDFPADGSYTVHAEATDVAGNVEASGLLATFNYDNTPPITTDSLSGTVGNNGFRSAVTVSLTATDAVSGVATTYYTIDNGSQQTYKGSPFSVSGQGAHQITFWSVDLAGNTESVNSASFNIAVVSLSQTTFVAAPLSVPAGGQSTITLTAVDANGNPVSGASVAFGLAAGSVGGTFGAVTDNGNGTYSATFTAGTQSGSDTLSASVYGQTVTSTAPIITVAAGTVSLSQSTISIPPAPLQAGSTAVVVLTARDAYGNLEGSGLSIAFSLGAGAGGGTFSAVTYTGNGVYTATFTATTAGSARTITATINGGAVTSALPTVTVTPGAASQLAVITEPSTSATAGGAFAVQPVVAEEDAFGNIITSDSTSTVTAGRGSQGTATLQGSNLTVTLSSGVATFSGLSYNTAEPMNIAFSTNASGVTSVTSNNVVVSPGAVTHLSVMPQSSSTTAGAGDGVLVTALDAYNNTTTDPDTVTFSSTDPQAGSPVSSTTTFNGGYAFAIATLKSATTTGWTITATAGTLSGQSSAITVTPAPATHFVITGPSSTLTLNSTSFTVTAYDPYNNEATGYSGTVHFTSSDGAVSAGSGLPVNSTLVNGTGTFTATLKTPGSQTITATDASNSTLVGNSNAIATRGLYVSSFATTPTGFTATFSKVVNLTTLDYYRFSASQSQAPDVAMATVGSATTNVNGTLLVSSTATQTTITFVATQGVLSNSAKYLATLTSGAGGIVDASGEQLAGDANGFLPGTNYVATNLAPASSTTPTLSIPGFARGPNSSAAVQITTNSVSATGIPITLTHAPANTTEVQFTLDFNPALLNVTGPTSGTFTLLNPGTANSTGVANFEYLGSALSTTSAVLGDIVADVPNSAANEMLQKTLLDLPVADIFFNGSATPASPVQNADGVQVVDYLGETTNNFGVINSVDASNAQAVVTANTTPTTANQPAGLQAFPLADPYLIAGSTGSTTFKVVAADVTGLNRFAVSLSHPFIPTPPTGLTYSSPGPDPTLSLPTNLQVTAGGIVTVPVDIDDPRPAGSDGMTQAELALTYNPAVFSLTSADVQLGTVPASGTGWTLTTQINPLTGQIAILLESQTPIRSAAGGSLVSIDFHVNPGATLGATPVNLAASVNPTGNAVVWTRLFDSQQEFTLSPAPSNTVSAAGIDAMVVVTPVDAGTAEGAGSNLGAPAEIGSVISAAPTLLPELTAAVAPVVVPEEDKQGIAAPVDELVAEGQTVHASGSADRTGSSVLEAVPFSANAGTTVASATSGLMLPLSNTAASPAAVAAAFAVESENAPLAENPLVGAEQSTRNGAAFTAASQGAVLPFVAQLTTNAPVGIQSRVEWTDQALPSWLYAQGGVASGVGLTDQVFSTLGLASQDADESPLWRVRLQDLLLLGDDAAWLLDSAAAQEPSTAANAPVGDSPAQEQSDRYFESLAVQTEPAVQTDDP